VGWMGYTGWVSAADLHMHAMFACRWYEQGIEEVQLERGEDRPLFST
jgi:hypothetical protein